MLSPMASTMPKRSVILPVATPPRPKLSMVSVKASDTAPRVAPNSGCTTGNTTTTDHIPTLPIEPISSASASRTHAWRESGVNAVESLDESEGACTGGNFVGSGLGVNPRWRDIGHANLGPSQREGEPHLGRTGQADW